MDHSLAERFRAVRAFTGTLCAPLQAEDYVVQSMPDASPVKWHLAHTSWFFEEFVLQRFAPGHRWYEPAYRYLFNSYYQSVGPMHARPQRGLLSRPAVAEVLAYRASVDERVLELLGSGTVPEATGRVLVLGLQHEQQHQELLLTDVKHLFSRNPLLPAYTAGQTSARAAAVPQLAFVPFEGGLVGVGHAGEGFAFDNEAPRHRAFLEPFALANRLVTNAEFRDFVRAGGYRRPELWLADGWNVLQSEGWARPLYWSESLDGEFTLTGRRELEPQAPVCHLSYYEADAFARWSEARLPTELEWEAVAQHLPVQGNFVEDGHWHPVPVGDVPRGAPAQMFGDVWEWTASAYAPYPGFRPLSGALGEYNGKFMVNQLVLRGGSCATARSHVRPTYRNFFHPAARWQFSGVRLAKEA